MLIDVDVCTIQRVNCTSNASCHNVDGSYNCSCNEGFQGNGTFCEGKIDSSMI